MVIHKASPKDSFKKFKNYSVSPSEIYIKTQFDNTYLPITKGLKI